MLNDFIGSLFAEGKFVIGQIEVREDWSLRHVEDRGVSGLQVLTTPSGAREIARYDVEGKFRPLKTAPSLKRGWILQLGSTDEVRLALEFFYPSAIGMLYQARSGRLQVTSLRETLGRQTGMYRVTQKTTDRQAEAVIRETCNSRSGCLRRLLWTIDEAGLRVFEPPKTTLEAEPGEVPLVCREACNLLVAACRKKVKAEEASS